MRADRVARTALVTLVLLAIAMVPSTALAGPKVQHWQTDNGAEVLFVHAPELPMVDARVTFDAGSARDDADPGIARLTSNLLMSGTEQLDADALARALARQGAEVSTGSARDMAWVKLRSLTAGKHLQSAAEHVRNLLEQPAFPKAAVQRLKSQQHTALTDRSESPGGIANHLFWQAVYGDHPYAHDPRGTEDSLEDIDRDALQAFHQRYYVGANANVAIVGDVDVERAHQLAKTLVGGLPRGDHAPPLPAVPELEDDRTIRESYPSTQAHILVGRAGIARGYDRWPALRVANHVLGSGGFTSRMYKELRQEQGLVYGASTQFSPMRARGPFRISLQTRGDQMDKALAAARKVFDRFDEEGPKSDEVDDAVTNIVDGFPLRIDSNADLVGYLSMMGFYGLSVDYLDRVPERVGKIDTGAAHAAFLDALGQRPRVTVIVGGDRATADDDADGAQAQ